MSNSVQAVYDWYEEYLCLCRKFDEQPLSIDDDFISRLIDLRKKQEEKK